MVNWTDCDGHRCGACEACYVEVIAKERASLPYAQRANLPELQEMAAVKDKQARLIKKLLELENSVEKKKPDANAVHPQPRLLDVELILCTGADKPLHSRTWADRNDNLIGECGVCHSLTACYIDDGQAHLSDHLAKPQGHRCSECGGPIWRDDEYMCVACIAAQGDAGG